MCIAKLAGLCGRSWAHSLPRLEVVFRMEQGSKLGLNHSGCSGRVLSVHKKVLATIKLERNCSVCLLHVPKDPLEGAGAALLSMGIQNLS